MSLSCMSSYSKGKKISSSRMQLLLESEHTIFLDICTLQIYCSREVYSMHEKKKALEVFACELEVAIR